MTKDIVLLLAGFIVGAMNAIAGGGMLVGFPVLVGLGVPPLLANATAYIVTLPGQVASAFGYRRYIRQVPLRYALLLLPIVVGAAAGSLTLRHTPADDFANIVPMLVLLGVLLFAMQPVLHFHLHSHVKGERRNWLPMVLLGFAMLPLSFYGGYFGAGYGFLMLAFLGLTSLRDTHMMNGMKNIAATFVSATSMLCLFSAHLIQWRTGLVMAAGSALGGYLGARGALKVSGQWLRVGIIVIGLAAAICLGIRQY
ncbi:MAG TPA: sulfite exporter TauE/SafE family protein [Candidatus Saccharimonadales bacterium]|nr:sulfite exporter TauE/SafE family protein [Candidatus Saccharimonadales bacterium]